MNLENKKYTIFNSLFISLRIAPFGIGCKLFLSILNSLISPIQIIVIANFIDSSIQYINGAQNRNTIILNVVFICLMQIYSKLSGTMLSLINQKISDKFQIKINPLILEKQAKLKYFYIENHETWNLITRVTSRSGFQESLNNSFDLLQLIVQITGIWLILASQIWWTTIVIVIISIPLMIVSIRSGKILYDMDKKVTRLTRFMNYYASILTNREAAAERTIFGYTDKINEKFMQAHKERTDTNLRTITSRMLRTKISGLILIIFGIFLMGILLNHISTGDISVGMYISFIGTLMSVLNGLSWRVGSILQNFSGLKEYYKEFNQFVNLEECLDMADYAKQFQKIEFEYLEFVNVSFKYPGTEKYVIKNVNLRLEKGNHYAVVGANGAGKTTIIKLITRLYDVQEGEILLNGKNINLYKYNELVSLFGIVYQDFAKYYISLKKNITFCSDDQNISETIKKAGLEDVVSNLPNGDKTILGKIDQDGIDISGGEWQKLAIARALYNDATFKILDEPTASLSPTAESEVYKNFQSIAKNDTTLLITHRLGSTKFVNEILVFDQGELVERGTHEFLMNKQGIYNTMFESQRKWYND